MTPQAETAVAAPATPTLQFDVPDAPKAPPPLNLPEAEDKPIATGLATVSDTPEKREGIVCMTMLPPGKQADAEKEAQGYLPQMLDNTQVLMNYGLDSLKGVNDLVDRLMKQLDTGNNPALKQIMGGLTLEVKSIKGKYDMNTPDGKKSYDEWEHGFLKKLWHKGRNYFESMLADVVSIEGQLEKIEKELNERKNETVRNITYLDQLYEENESAVFQLIYAIAVMESIADLARQEAKKIPDDPPGTGNTNAEKKKRLADLIMQMDVKLGEYKGRLFVAWSTSPQVRMMRVLDVGMAEKLNEAVGMTIPTMKLVIFQWTLMAKSLEAAKETDAVSNTTNVMVQELAKTSAESAGVIMEAVQKPTLLPETVTVVTDSMTLMSENILAAIDTGNQQRAELENTMASAKTVLDGNSHDFDEAIVSKIVAGSTQKVELPVSKPVLTLPEKVGS